MKATITIEDNLALFYLKCVFAGVKVVLHCKFNIQLLRIVLLWNNDDIYMKYKWYNLTKKNVANSCLFLW